MFDSKAKTRKKLEESFGRIKADTYYFEYIERYFRKREQSDALQVLSDKTCNDLDFNELFMFIDRTTSNVGQQFLYNTLRTIPLNGDKATEEERLIELLTRDAGLRLNLQSELYRLTSESAYFITSLFQDDHIKKPKWFFIIPLLSFTSLISLLMLMVFPRIFFLLLAVIIVNLGIHYWNKNNLNEYLGSIVQLLKLNSVAKNLLKYDMRPKSGTEVIGSVKIIDRLRKRLSLFNMEARLQGDIGIAFWSILELIKALFLLEPLLLFGVLKQLDSKRKEIENVFSFVGYIDTIISVASLRAGLKYFCIPEVKSSNKVIEAVEMYHPLIVDCVPNSINVTDRSILLTGSNMSGKTSFIRTLGLNVITALTINTCFASKFSLSRLKIFSAIRLSDDLMNDKSYYFEEVLTIKEMIEQSQVHGYNLFLLDEIFKGTNTIERISAGKAVLSFLNNENNVVFVSTHDIELAELLRDAYSLYHFSEQVGNRSVDFDFKLKKGKLQNRNAIRILEINDYPKEIIDEAIGLSKELDKIFIINEIKR